MNNLSIPEYGIIVSARIECATSRFGHPLPTLYLRFHPASAPRLRNATLHMLAARLEAITSSKEAWVAYIERRSDLAGAIHIELAEATEEEAARAIERLRQIAR